jgi:hypothetical protein
MAMRRLERALRGAGLLSIAALHACGSSDPAAVTVEMELDPASCAIVPDPADLGLACEATAGVWLRSASGETIDRACVDFGSDAPTLADLPPLLAGIDLPVAEGEGISVEVAVYAPWQSASGCPEPDEVTGSAEASPIVVRGSSQPADLSESDGRIAVTLECGAIAAPAPDAECVQGCATEEEECFAGVASEACELEFEQCEDSCDPEDEDCFDDCLEGHDTCLLETDEGACTLEFELCVDECSPDDEGCFNECDDGWGDCMDAACGDLSEQCELDCAAEPGCASVAAGG